MLHVVNFRIMAALGPSIELCLGIKVPYGLYWENAIDDEVCRHVDTPEMRLAWSCRRLARIPNGICPLWLHTDEAGSNGHGEQCQRSGKSNSHGD